MKVKSAVFMVFTAAAIMLAAIFNGGASDKDELLGAGYTSENNNLHRIDGPKPDPGGQRSFRLYRSAAPSRETFSKWCSEYGIERVIVMDGTASTRELKFQREGVCEDIQVVYNVNQGLTPVSDGFLEWFDKEVESAKNDKAGLLFRCKTGSHRTGRLAAYYQMKYQGVSLEDALAVMDHKGKMMEFWNMIFVPQVVAIDDYIQGKPCSQTGASCVVMDADFWVPVK